MKIINLEFVMSGKEYERFVVYVLRSNDHLEEVIAVLKGKEYKQPVPEAVDDTEEVQNLYEQALQQTEDYLLKQWMRTGAEFEKVVAAVLEAIGYSTRVTAPTHDKGIDVVAHPDPLGLEQPYIKVQVKSGTGAVGGPTVNQLKGTLQPGEKGMIVTLGSFTRDAQAIDHHHSNIVLIDGPGFVKLFTDNYHQLDAKWQAKYPLKRVYVPNV